MTGPTDAESDIGSGSDASVEELLSWTVRGSAPLVPEIVLHLADDIHRTWERTDEEAPPFWAFAWAGGQALARHVLDHPDTVAGRHVLDLAAGSGLVGLAALRAGATSVVLADTDARALVAARANAEANGLTVELLADDLLAPDAPVLDIDVVLAGDVFYEQPMARHMETYLDVAAGIGVDVLVGDPGREYLPRRRCTELGCYDVPGTIDLEGRATTPTRVWAFGPRA